MDVKLGFKAKDPDVCQMILEGTQEDLIHAFTQIYHTVYGKEFIDRIHKACEIAKSNTSSSLN